MTTRLRVFLGLCVLPAAAAALAQADLRTGEVMVRLETALGEIDLAIDIARAPITAANFLKYVDGGFYDGGRFHRATRADNYTPSPPNRPLMGIIQAGSIPRGGRRASRRSRSSAPARPASHTSSASSRWRAADPTRRRRTSSSC